MTLVPVDQFAGEDADFNRDAAEQVYEQIMKMDADSALVYGRMLVGAAVQRDLIVHHDAVEQQIAKALTARVEAARAHLVRTSIAKARNGEDASAELEAFTLLSKSFIGDFFSHSSLSERAKKQKRDLSTGQFQVMHEKITHTPGALPIPGPYATKLNIPDPAAAGVDLSAEQRAAYQNGYHQVQRLIRPYVELPKGEGRLTFHYDEGAPTYTELPHGEAKIPVVGTETTRKVIENGVEREETNKATQGIDPARKITAVTLDVVPGLNARGAAFASLNALGMPKLGARLAGAMQGGAADPDKLANFEQTWNTNDANDTFVPSQKVFRRLGAGADLIEGTLGATAPPQARLALAAAKHVGRLGPVAQRIVGPTMDRAAYRYRGTEREVDPQLQRQFAETDQLAAKSSGAATVADRELRESLGTLKARLAANSSVYNDRIKTAKSDWDKASVAYRNGRIDRKDHTNKAKTAQKEIEEASRRKRNADDAAHDQFKAAERKHQKASGAANTQRSDRALTIAREGIETDGIWNPGPVLTYMQGRVPSPELNELQLKSGVVPPSEGVIIDSKGKVAAQTVGYGDDHYLPFTLRNLAKLRGGHYIRTRTFGGPTTEDIHTALISGAKGLTVVSNSGVFSVDFDHNLKGGRRFNDKAARMVGRYGHLLDAVKNGSVAGADIDPSRQQEIYRAAREMYPDDPDGYQREARRLLDRERQDPQLSGTEKEKVAVRVLNDQLAQSGATDGEVQMSLGDIADRLADQDMRTLRAQTPNIPGSELGKIRASVRAKYEDPDPEQRAIKIATAMGPSTRVALETHLRAAREEQRRNMQDLSLNGRGYARALDALQQQFPYYLQQPKFFRFRDGKDGVDSGYVKPNHNRPESALAGFYDRTVSPAGKATADSIRYQNGSATVRAPRSNDRQGSDAEEMAAAGGGGTPAGPVSAEDARRLKAQTDGELLDHLLAQEKFADDMPEFAPGMSAAGMSIRGAASDPAFPAALRKVYGPGAEDEMRQTLANDPERAHRELGDAVNWIEQYKALRLDRGLVTRHRNEGRPPEKAAYTNATSALADPDREFDLAHESPAYDADRSPTKLAIEGEYDHNGAIQSLVNAGLLPDHPADREFRDQADALAAQLSDDDKAETRWATTGKGFPGPRLSREQVEQQARGLVRANQLARRYSEAVGREAEVQARNDAAARANEPNQAVSFMFSATPEQLREMDDDEKAAYFADAANMARAMGGAAGQPAIENGQPPLTDAEKELARRFGMSA